MSLNGDSLIVESPVVFPMCCAGCKGTLGPLLDTLSMFPPNRRIYFCQSCVADAARLFGLVDGDKATELTTAIEQRDRAVRESKKAADRLADAEHAVAEKEAAVEALLGELADREARVSQLEARIAGDAQAALELIGGKQ